MRIIYNKFRIRLSITSEYKGDKNWNFDIDDKNRIDNYNNHIIIVKNTSTRRQCQYEYWNSIVDGEITDNKSLLQAFNCLLLDCTGVMYNQSFQEFCSEYGYNSDSIKALKIYNACKKQYQKASRILNYKDELIWKIIQDIDK